MDSELYHILKSLLYSKEEKVALLDDMKLSLKDQKKSICKKIKEIEKQIKELTEC